MSNRRQFLKSSLLLSVGALLPQRLFADNKLVKLRPISKAPGPVVISTWAFGVKANQEAWQVLESGKRAIDAVEKGVMLVENDPNERSVGYGGRPDRDGVVTLDACIMDDKANIGSVVALEGIKNPIAVARLVMEKTPHVMLAGKGAQEFALSQGFQLEDLLTEESKKEWENWRIDANYTPIINIENHDTIAQLAIDKDGNISGACTTSGMAFKMHGRVGDSPIIGAGLFVDNKVGAAAATGHGEEVIRTVGSFLVVELMRSGLSPSDACRTAVERIRDNFTETGRNLKDTQIGFIALAKDGTSGAYCLRPGFNYALKSQKQDQLINAPYLVL